jgi:hypothetical protein
VRSNKIPPSRRVAQITGESYRPKDKRRAGIMARPKARERLTFFRNTRPRGQELGVVLVTGTSNGRNRIGQLFEGAMARVGLVVTDSSFFDDVPCPRSQPAKTQMSSHRRPTVCGIRNN